PVLLFCSSCSSLVKHRSTSTSQSPSKHDSFQFDASIRDSIQGGILLLRASWNVSKDISSGRSDTEVACRGRRGQPICSAVGRRGDSSARDRNCRTCSVRRNEGLL